MPYEFMCHMAYQTGVRARKLAARAGGVVVDEQVEEITGAPLAVEY